jgi:hypothetical protein
MKITIIKKSNDKVKSAVIAACPWILDDPALAPRK